MARGDHGGLVWRVRAQGAGMTTRTEGSRSLEAEFDEWLSQRRDHQTLRQQFWAAWQAGAEWALRELRKNAGLPEEKRP